MVIYLASFEKWYKKQKSSSPDKPTEIKQLQTLTINQLNAISGASRVGLGMNHNESIFGVSNRSKKQKPSSPDQTTEVKELEKLGLKQLEAIAGGFGITINHNENLVSFSN